MIGRWNRKRYFRAVALCLVAATLVIPSTSPTVIAQESAAVETEKSAGKPIPRGPKRYKGREIAVTMHYLGAPWLVRDRAREEDCAMLLEALHVKPGQTICDLGCGNGFYTLQLAKLVGDQGKVFAVDIQPEMLHLLDERAKAEEIDQYRADSRLADRSTGCRRERRPDSAGGRLPRVLASRTRCSRRCGAR